MEKEPHVFSDEELDVLYEAEGDSTLKGLEDKENLEEVQCAKKVLSAYYDGKKLWDEMSLDDMLGFFDAELEAGPRLAERGDIERTKKFLLDRMDRVSHPYRRTTQYHELMDDFAADEKELA